MFVLDPVIAYACTAFPFQMRSGQGQDSDEPEFQDRVTVPVKGRKTVYAGVMLRLRCPAGKGVEKAGLIWMKGHEYLRVQPDRMEIMHKIGVLKIKNTTYSDSGIYTCVCKLNFIPRHLQHNSMRKTN